MALEAAESRGPDPFTADLSRRSLAGLEVDAEYVAPPGRVLIGPVQDRIDRLGPCCAIKRYDFSRRHS